MTRLGEDTYLYPVLPTQDTVAEYLGRGWLEPNIERLKELVPAPLANNGRSGAPRAA